MVLTACNIGGIVNEGGGFKQMTDDHGIQSVEKLYAGVVDDLLSSVAVMLGSSQDSIG